MATKKPTIVISGGDPSGIGPEVILKALKEPWIIKKADIIVIGTFEIFKKTAKILKFGLYPGRPFTFVDLKNVQVKNFRFGIPRASYGSAAVDYIMYAASIVQNRKRAALVTAPVNKESVNKAGYKFPGQTELLARITKAKSVTMMLAGGNLRVSLVTRHVPLEKVAALLNKKKIIETAENTHFALKRIFKIARPKIAVAALNPHAGEGGFLGREEKRIIIPAVKYLKKKIKNIAGPFPPDTLFHRAQKGEFDAVLCMYHDQGLIPLKMTAFESGVNLTIGLPFVRTSPDHGTAFDIAGKGKADPSSMIEAIKLAAC